MSSAEFEQVRQAVQPVLDEASREASAYYHYLQEGGKRAEWRTAYAGLVRAAMLAVVDACRKEHHRWDIVGPPDCPRCVELVALRKEIEEDALSDGRDDQSRTDQLAELLRDYAIKFHIATHHLEETLHSWPCRGSLERCTQPSCKRARLVLAEVGWYE